MTLSKADVKCKQVGVLFRRVRAGGELSQDVRIAVCPPASRGSGYRAAFSAPFMFFMSLGLPLGCSTIMSMAHLPTGDAARGAL